MKTYFLAFFSMLVLGTFNTALADLRCSVVSGSENNWVFVNNLYLMGEKATLTTDKNLATHLAFHPISANFSSVASTSSDSSTHAFKSEVLINSEEQYSSFYLLEQISSKRWLLSEYKTDKDQDAFGLSASVEMICK